MVRVDFVAYSPTEKDAKGQFLPAFCQRVVMSPDSFLQWATAKMQEAAQAMAQLAQRPAASPAAEPVAPAAPARPAPAAEPASSPKRPFP